MKEIETKKRSIVKAVVWRISGVVILGVISWLITKSWKEVTIITLVFHSIRLVLYYVHERIWEKISWGRIKHPLSDINVNRELDPEDKKIIEDKLKGLGYID